MAVNTETVTVKLGMETYKAYFAAPADGGPRPGIVVLQEIFGVNEHIRAVTERLAEAGYACIAPDMFWRQKPGFTSGYSPEEIAAARELKAQVDNDRLVAELRGSYQALGNREECDRDRIGVVGFCFGGLMTYLYAARMHPKCAVSYYGGGIVNYLGDYFKIGCPILFHFGELDESIPMNEVEQIKEYAAKAPVDATIHTYPEAGHGFNCDLRGSYHEPSANEAWERTLKFFKEHLG